ncbi:MAG: hypothetical protein ACE5IJ_03710, partial [Thermoplasmata archaeon]
KAPRRVRFQEFPELTDAEASRDHTTYCGHLITHSYSYPGMRSYMKLRFVGNGLVVTIPRLLEAVLHWTKGDILPQVEKNRDGAFAELSSLHFRCNDFDLNYYWTVPSCPPCGGATTPFSAADTC